MRKCEVCWFDLILVESVQENVDLTYPHPIHGRIRMNMDLCSKHLAIALSPDNTVEVHS